MIRPTQADLWAMFAAAAIDGTLAADIEKVEDDLSVTSFAADVADKMMAEFNARFYNDAVFGPSLRKEYDQDRDHGDENGQ